MTDTDVAHLIDENQTLRELVARYATKRPRKAPAPRSKRAHDLHPAVVFLLDEMEHEQVSGVTMCALAGLSCNAITNWRHKHGPTVAHLERALNVLGYTLAAVPRPEKK